MWRAGAERGFALDNGESGLEAEGPQMGCCPAAVGGAIGARIQLTRAANGGFIGQDRPGAGPLVTSGRFSLSRATDAPLKGTGR
jgi:hypothetical protein